LEFSVVRAGSTLLVKDSTGQGVPWSGASPALAVERQRIQLEAAENGEHAVVLGAMRCGTIKKTAEGYVVAGQHIVPDVRQAVSLHLSLVRVDKTGPVPVYVWPDGSRHDAY